MTRGSMFTCYYCGAKEKCTRDHFIPKSKKGTLCVYACRICQTSKANMMPLDWLDYLRSHPLINLQTLVRVDNAVRSLWIMIVQGEINAYNKQKTHN